MTQYRNEVKILDFKTFDTMTDIIDSERGRKSIITKEDLVKRFFFELTTDGEIDYALPLQLTKDIFKFTNEQASLFVYFYPKNELIKKYGGSELLYPLCKESLDLLKKYNAKTGYDYPVPSE